MNKPDCCEYKQIRRKKVDFCHKNRCQQHGYLKQVP